MRTLTLVVPDPPPFREHPGRSADRNSPYAGPLAREGEEAVASSRDEFPFVFTGMTVRYGRTIWNVDQFGYQPDGPIYEVLCDVGAACDPDGWWSYDTQDPEADFYVVTFTSEEPHEDREPRPELSWSEIPEDYVQAWERRNEEMKQKLRREGLMRPQS
jgi:hypothetical protein